MPEISGEYPEIRGQKPKECLPQPQYVGYSAFVTQSVERLLRWALLHRKGRIQIHKNRFKVAGKIEDQGAEDE